MNSFVPLVQKNIKHKSLDKIKNGILYLKGGNLDEELSLFPEALEIPLSNYFDSEFFKTKKLFTCLKIFPILKRDNGNQ
jgi:16S rRNA (guanine527-N7)-methyltransferase